MGKLAVMCRCLGALNDGGEAKVAGQMSGSSTRPSGPGTSNFNCDQDSRAVLIEPFPILYSVKPPLVRMMCFEIQSVSLLHLHLCLSRGSRMRLSKCFETLILNLQGRDPARARVATSSNVEQGSCATPTIAQEVLQKKYVPAGKKRPCQRRLDHFISRPMTGIEHASTRASSGATRPTASHGSWKCHHHLMWHRRIGLSALQHRAGQRKEKQRGE